MEKLSMFLEKITKNKQKNGIIIAISAIIFILSIIFSAISVIFNWNLINILLPIGSFAFAILGFYLSFNKLRETQDALAASEVYILKLEAENKEYKVNTDVLLNDPQIKRIMINRMSKLPRADE